MAPERVRSAALALAAISENPGADLLAALERSPCDRLLVDTLLEVHRVPALEAWSALLRGEPPPRSPQGPESLDREALRLCGVAALSAPLGAVLRVLRPLLIEEVARLERPSGVKLDAERGRRFRGQLDWVEARLRGLQMPVISGWLSAAPVSAVVLVPGEGYRVYLTEAALESPWPRAAIARCVALHAWGLEPVWHLPSSALERWCAWLEAARRGEDAPPPSGELRGQDAGHVLSVLGEAGLSSERCEALRRALARSLDRVTWVALGSLEEALVAMAPRGLERDALPTWVAGSASARALLRFAAS